jgi:hypothetical protein
MTDPTEWPEYDVGPRESVFALGVASVSYARLEFAFSGVFAKVLGKTNDEVWSLLPKRPREMRQHLREPRLARQIESSNGNQLVSFGG